MSDDLDTTSSETRDLAILAQSGLFDTEWFDKRNPDLRAAGVEPLEHFHRYGWREHRLPNA